MKEEATELDKLITMADELGLVNGSVYEASALQEMLDDMWHLLSSEQREKFLQESGSVKRLVYEHGLYAARTIPCKR